ncbi:hypothetical protein HPB51_009002 [Rhipicephalus microplus]|uniref:Uncharacterized protein n=1 Tax=Rhipicephalus microplus TaxID=6941 RepID=A0A9J6ES37_RHIMP|nr:hypothetical protein HPB51_009002 [Rhipicephalus microplus]
MCVVTDNNSVNRSAVVPFKYSVSKAPQAVSRKSLANDFVFPHPSDPHRPLFFVIDPVHLLKCVRNNWLKQNDQCFWLPQFEPSTTGQRHMQYAYFKTVKDAYNLESKQLLRYGYTLSRKAVSPTDIEKQDVKPALQVFSEYGPNALRVIGAKHNLKHYEETVSFIDVIVRWWKVVNVKTQAFIKICAYCFEELKMSFVLLGKFQTDLLEERFGCYRRLAGSQYHLSVR